ncbi:MAG: 50S ribosomal protein L29 [Sphaerochaetaceae bacterium]|jgi:large subunit ribosomal protein L29|nr:50S ribosomal protein L29 [Sphaerochaetaceae bacterium]NLO59760.1 50S ribosomal protein L29 [Spirochaetales bacterium]MDD2405191.1 50S ribosomal protein L29 [Sphaerochaetaceae bacterium]MDD3670579.1 50S ribosomal protein L29 [Sphaerochaetaceae bacterium]MDD4258837.1 50S ribosomal protein L29 [Sphaerochaetaceae bacterium]
MKNSYSDLTYAELVAKRDELRREALNLRMARVLGHVENPLAIRTTRRQIARLNTLIHEYALGIRVKSK